jgi:hypothetical protein
MKRPSIPHRVMVNVAIEQAGGWIRCALCTGPLRPEDPRILEHLVPHELDGSSDAENLRWVHKECAGRKTNGSRATSAGGDIHKIAKAKRLATKHSQPNKPGTIKSRGFQGSRKFNGEANWRNK